MSAEKKNGILPDGLHQWEAKLTALYRTKSATLAATEALEPVREADGEIVLGVCPEVSRYLWVMAWSLRQNLSGKSHLEFAKMRAGAEMYEQKFALAMMLHFGETLSGISMPVNLKIREGWQVVYVRL